MRISSTTPSSSISSAGDYNSARQLAQRLVRRQTDNSIAHVFLGLDAYRHRDYAQADRQFKERASREPPRKSRR